jgi:serine/threonine protein kinase
MPDESFSAPSLASMASLLPSFEFTATVSSGDRSAVYFANQRSLDLQVAIKLFPPVPGFLSSFETIARRLAGLTHKNIVGLLDSGVLEGMPYLVLEFVPGKSLAHSTKGHAVEFEQAMTLLDGICEGLAHAHSKDIVHGRLAPSNILLNQDAEPKIGNFGLLRFGEAGTKPDHFTAPEVLMNPAAASKRSDVYSVAAIFYELVTGSAHGPDAAPPSSRCTSCRPEVDLIWKQATDPDPSKRMADASAFRTALKQAAAGGKARTPAPAQAGKPAGNTAGNSGGKARSSGGFDWKLVRNFAIIIALLYGVSLAWENLKLAREKRDKENQQVLAKQEAAKEEALAEAARERARELAKTTVVGDGNQGDSKIAKTVETPLESLERLRSGLVSGRRTEMPVGSVQKGDADYFLVTERMTWPDAAIFAEDHGGHLAVPGAEADAGWLLVEVSKGKAAWIGVARGGQDSWTQVTGGIWDSTKEPAGSGMHLSVEEKGLVATDGYVATRPFLIQWHRDGSNPGKLASQFAATAQSLSQSPKFFPPGTVTFGNRHFLHVRRPMNWEDAGKLAEQAGGTLMVVSNPEEAANLKAMTPKLDSGKRIWLGGLLDGSLWKWSTGEVWVMGDWADDADATDENSALCIRPGIGWDGLNRGEEASGFIIEWSEDAKAGSVPPVASGDDVSALLERAKEVIVAAEKKRSEDLEANVKKFSWDLDAFVRGLNKSGQQQWSPEVERLKRCTKDDRFLPEEVRLQDIVVSNEMLKIAEYAARKQIEIDAKFAETIKAVRDSFVVKLTAIRDEALKSGQIKVAEDTREIIESAADLDEWVGSFGS